MEGSIDPGTEDPLPTEISDPYEDSMGTNSSTVMAPTMTDNGRRDHRGEYRKYV